MTMPWKPVRSQWVVCVCAAAALSGCGAGNSGGALAATPSAAAADAGANPPATSGSAATEVAPPTTTSVTGSGDEKGTKLPEAHAPAPSSAADAGATLPGRGREAGRTPSDIKAMISAHRDEARACYDKGLANHPGLEGDLVMQWVIDPKGAVSHVTLDPSRSQITEPSVATCIAAVIEKLQFAPSPGGFETRAFYPFNFHPHHGTPKPNP
jgi:hypothetical protein